MANLICKKCGYKLKGANTGKCPYCGEMSLEEEESAEQLIQDVERLIQ